MKYKLVFIDLDGTLLNSKNQISSYNCNIIKKIQTQNVKVILSSARGIYRIKKYYEQLELSNSDTYIISYNGSIVIDNNENKIIDEKIANEDIFRLIEIINTHEPTKWNLYSYDSKTNFKDIQDIDKFILNNDIYKINCVSSAENIETLKNNISESIKSTFQIASSLPTHISFVKKGSTKLMAIKKIMQLLSVKQEEIITIGDGENDLEMLEYAGCGIAMKNANEKVKQKVKLITDSNDNDGVGKALEIILNEK